MYMNMDNIQFTNADLIELFYLCRDACDKYLDPDNDIYKWFHDESNIADAKENSNARSETNN